MPAAPALTGSALTGSALTSTARLVVRLAWIANRAFGVAVCLALPATFLFFAPFAGIVGRALPGADMAEAIEGIRLLLAVGIVMALATDRLLAGLAGIIATAGVGDPFIAANAGRLATIGWCLVVLQLLDIPAAFIASGYPAMGSAAPDGEISIAGWIAVLMAFVLARVFAAGTAMRDDLDGTV